MLVKKKPADLLVDLIKDPDEAEAVINDYCSWRDKSIPFSFQKNGVIYALYRDVVELLPNYAAFATARNFHRDLYVNLGSLRITDTSMRCEFIKNKGNITSWLHNSSGLMLGLTSQDPLFNKFLSKEYKVQFSPIYKLSYLEHFLGNKQNSKVEAAPKVLTLVA